MSTGLAVWCQNSKEDHGEHTPGPVSGTWEDHGMLSCCAVWPSSSSRAGHAVSLQPNIRQAWAQMWQPRAGRARHRHHNHSPALSAGAQAASSYSSPNFTWKHRHLHTDATALQSSHNSRQPMAGVAGCFAINSRENGSSCDSHRVLSTEPGAALVFSVE